MKRTHTGFFAVLWLISVGAAGTSALAQEKLDAQLGALERLRRGLDTAFDQVERLGQQMLKDYQAAEDQGRIYYQLAHNYAQSGISIKERADKVIEYAPKGLACPLDPVRRLRLYVYWGDALKAGDQSKPPRDRRKAAALVWLKGLKEAQQYNIPDKPPGPAPAAVLIDAPASPYLGALRKKAEEIYATQRRIEYETNLHRCRTVLIMQLVDVYGQAPHAASELRELATSILGDAPMVETLMNRLKDVGALEDEQPPAPVEPQ